MKTLQRYNKGLQEMGGCSVTPRLFLSNRGDVCAHFQNEKCRPYPVIEGPSVFIAW